MKDVLTWLVTQLVDDPHMVRVEQSMESDRTILTLHVHQSDMGKVIGKSGRIIKAIRDLLKILAAKRNQYVDVVLADEENNVSQATGVSEVSNVSNVSEVS